MEYKDALEKAWGKLQALTEEKRFSVRLMADTYDLDIEKKSVFSVSCNAPSKDYISLLALHYLVKKLELKILPKPTGDWISFKQLEGSEGYYPAFKKRTIDILKGKFGSDPEGLLTAVERFSAKRVQIGDVGIAIEAFEDVPVLISMWKGDEEFGPDANISFDRSVSDIFCTEDIVVLTEFVVHSL